MKTLTTVSITALFIASLTAAQAQTTISSWNFNSNPSDASVSTGILIPSTGSGTISLIGGVTSTFATGSPGDPASSGNDNSGLNISTWSAQGTGSGNRGLQVAASTVGFDNITISLDFRQSGTVSRDFQLQASSDGVNFNNVSGGTASFGTVNANTGTSFSNSGLYVNNPGGGSQTFVQSINYAFAPGSIYENDPHFAFRWVAVFDSGTGGGTSYISANAGTTAAYSTSGTGRFDEVGVSGVAIEATPEPTTLALGGLGLAALAILRRNRKA